MTHLSHTGPTFSCSLSPCKHLQVELVDNLPEHRTLYTHRVQLAMETEGGAIWEWVVGSIGQMI